MHHYGRFADPVVYYNYYCQANIMHGNHKENLFHGPYYEPPLRFMIKFTGIYILNIYIMVQPLLYLLIDNAYFLVF